MVKLTVVCFSNIQLSASDWKEIEGILYSIYFLLPFLRDNIPSPEVVWKETKIYMRTGIPLKNQVQVRKNA